MLQDFNNIHEFSDVNEMVHNETYMSWKLSMSETVTKTLTMSNMAKSNASAINLFQIGAICSVSTKHKQG